MASTRIATYNFDKRQTLDQMSSIRYYYMGWLFKRPVPAPEEKFNKICAENLKKNPW